MSESVVWDWRQAEVMLDERELFVLWTIKTYFCTRLEDFHRHFAADFPAEDLITDLEKLGFLQRDGVELVLTELGESAVTFLGEAKRSKYAQLLREAASVAKRFEAADKDHVEIIEEAETSSEYTLVERPLVEQLQKLGWSYLSGDKFISYLTERDSFREVLLTSRLRAALRSINKGKDGKEWLDDRRAAQAINALERVEGFKLMEINEAVTDMLRVGTDVEGTIDYDEGRPRRVRFFDFENPEANDFLIINQFRVDTPSSSRYIVADAVLFVNGIPLVVIECKSPALTNPVAEGITQLRRYSNQRTKQPGGVNLGEEVIEGAENLFYYNQILLSTCFYEARAGSIGATEEYFLEWKDTYPLSMREEESKLGVQKLSSQQMLVAGMFAPANLLEILRNFVLFRETGGRKVKIIPRYKQFSAVMKAVERLEHGKTRQEHGEMDQRGGIIWHTQGSGKSLTMVYLIRKMRRKEKLRDFKIVIVTDRTDLQDQLSHTAALTGEKPLIPRNIEALERELREDSPDIVFSMIQKLRPEATTEASREVDEEQTAAEIKRAGELNPSSSILLLIDEAQRSHANKLHAALMDALPNSAKIGFTGTPILMGKGKKTQEIFGPFLDRYTIKESELDGATVPILYEGRRVEGVLLDKQSIDFYFETEFAHLTAEARAEAKRRYVNQPEVAKALKLIAAKADNMLRHYVETILPDGFKAQVVVTDREAAVRYQQAFVQAKENLLREVKAFNLAPSSEQEEMADDETRFLTTAHKQLPVLERLEFAAVISGTNNDPEHYRQWTEAGKQARYIERFKKALRHENPTQQDGLAFLCVADMLITGFDAPIEGVLYLDRKLQEHKLLQAIARVNRTHPNKTGGLVVDYHGVAQELKEALAVYTAEDIQGAVVSIRDELPLLSDRHRRARALFDERGLDIHSDKGMQACVDLLADAELRADFVVKVKKFLQSMNIVLPRPQALRFTRDAERLGLINRVAARLYRDEQLNLTGIGEKVRQLIDEYVEAEGIYVEVPPVSITDPDFDKAVDERSSDRAKASEMEHAARYHITKHYQEDPAYYKKLSERLQEILKRFSDNWAARIEALRELTQDIRTGRPPNEFGLDLRLDARFYDIVVEEASKERELTHEHRKQIASLTVRIVEVIRRHLERVDFWRSNQNREELAREIVALLDKGYAIDIDRQEAVADLLVELARSLNSYLTT